MRVAELSKWLRSFLLTTPEAWPCQVEFDLSSLAPLQHFPLQETHLNLRWSPRVADSNREDERPSKPLDELSLLPNLKLHCLDLELSGALVKRETECDFRLFWLSILPLRRLNLRGCHVTDIGVAHLSGLTGHAGPCYDVLQFDFSKINIDTNKFFVFEIGLQALDMSDTLVSNSGLASLSSLHCLTELKLNRLDKEAVYFEGHIRDLYTGEGVQYLSVLPLRVLELSCCELTQDGIALLPKTLETLDISGALINDSGLALLSCFSQLNCLKLFGCELRLVDLEILLPLHLSHLSVEIAQGDDDGAEVLCLTQHCRIPLCMQLLH